MWQYVKSYPELMLHREIQHRILVTMASDGWLQRADD
jgi:hypothetical protein